MKPKLKLTGTDGNVFAIIGKVCRALRQAGQSDRAKEFSDQAFGSGSYDAVLQLAMEFCEVS